VRPTIESGKAFADNSPQPPNRMHSYSILSTNSTISANSSATAKIIGSQIAI
jgi:hypothetical protein